MCKDYTIVLCHDGRYDRENFIISIEKSERDAKDILKVHVRRPVEGENDKKREVYYDKASI